MSQQKWYYLNASMQKVGPITSKALKSLAESGAIRPDTTLITEDGTKVVSAGKVKGLFPEGNAQSAPAPAASVASQPPAPPVLPVASPSVVPMPEPMSFDFPASDPFANLPTSSTPDGPDWNSLGTAVSTAPAPQPAQTGRPGGYPGVAYATPDPSDEGKRTLLIALVAAVAIFLCMALALFLASKSNERASDREGAGPPPAVLPDEQPFDQNPAGADPGRNRNRKPVLEDDDWDVDDGQDDEPAAAPNEPGRKPNRKPNVEDDEEDADIWDPVDEPRADRRPPRRGELRSTEDLIAEFEGSVALISGDHSSGSGFVVMPGVIATNSHVINSEEITDLEVHFPSQNGVLKGPFKPRLLYEDSDRDLAFLSIPSRAHVVLNIKKDYRFRRGQEVIAIGSPGRGDGKLLENAVSKGLLSTQTEVDDQPYYQLSIAVNSGNSGGPVLDYEGDVLGVVTLKATKTEAMAYCIPPNDVLKAMAVVRKADKTQIAEHREKHEMMLYVHRGLEKLALVMELSGAAAVPLIREGIEDFDRAILKNPDCVEAFLGRAMLKGAQNDFQGMSDDLDRAIRASKDEEQKKKLRELQAEIKKEIQYRQQVAGIPRPFGPRGFGGIRPHLPPPPPRFSVVPDMPNRPGRVVPGEIAPDDSLLMGAARESRYRSIVQKDQWLFNGRPLYATLIGYEDGVAIFRGKDTGEDDPPIRRYANRFSQRDIEDIKFYATYNGIPLGDLRKR